MNEPDFSRGLVPAVLQDAQTLEVLMVAYMDQEAWAKTLETGRAWFRSRSRGLWEKGSTSGNHMEVVERRLDCDADTILLKVNQIGGAACHEGYKSCFFRQITPDGLKTIGERVFDPKQVYKK